MGPGVLADMGGLFVAAGTPMEIFGRSSGATAQLRLNGKNLDSPMSENPKEKTKIGRAFF